MLIEKVEQKISEALKDMSVEDYSVTVELTPDNQKGDFTFNCFPLAKILRKNPAIISKELKEKLEKEDIFLELEAVSGYLNVIVKRDFFFSSVLSEIMEEGLNYGTSNVFKGKSALVEYSAPNTNKPQHLGHVRNNVLGMALSNVLENAGYDLSRVNLVNDRGIHICKSMLAYKKWGEGSVPGEIKGDHFVGNFYVLFDKKYNEEYEAYLKENPGKEIDKDEFFKISELGREAQHLLQLWEKGDEETITLWKTMNKWVMEGFMETYERLGCKFDKIYLESETYKLGKDIVLKALNDGVVYKSDKGAIKIDLASRKLDEKVLLRSDGTSVYMTQDIGTTLLKHDDYNPDLMFWVVADEQNYHFKVLFSILEILGYEWAKNCIHYSYGMINLPEGKMKSREGTVVDADDLIDRLKNMVFELIKERGIDEQTIPSNRLLKLALAALKFMILKVNPSSTMIFNPKEAISFEGDTGPYVLYVYVRCEHILNKAKEIELENIDFSKLDKDEEVALVKDLVNFPRMCLRVAREYNVSLIASYLLGLSKRFHKFYHLHDVLHQEDEELKKARLALVQCVRDVIHKGLKLLSIDVVEEM